MLPRYDFHVHTNYSDGPSDPSRMVESAWSRGLEAVALTDHGPQLPMGVEPGEIESMIKDMELVRADVDIEVLLGLEANAVDPEGNLDVDDSVLDKLDVVVAGVHYLDTPGFSPERTSKLYLKTVMNMMELNEIDVLAHPFWYYRDLSKHLSDSDVESFAEVAVREGVSIELNEKYRAPRERVLVECFEKGARFSFGSDAHSPDEVGSFNWAHDVAEDIGLGEEDLNISHLI